jgi:hypothetical protein
MCNSGCAVIFTANKVAVKHGACATILTGTREKESGLLRFTLGEPSPGKSLPQHTEHNVYNKILYKTQFLIYMHVVSALYKTLGSKLFKVNTLQHGQ